MFIKPLYEVTKISANNLSTMSSNSKTIDVELTENGSEIRNEQQTQNSM